MSGNEYGIMPANFDNSPAKFFLDDPAVYIKVLNDTNWTLFRPLGYAELGKSFSTEKEYAEFRAGIPERLIAKDVVGIKQFFSCQLKQLQPETIAMLQEAVIEDDTGETRVFMGSQQGSPLDVAIILKGKTRDGKSIELRIRKAQPTTESINLALGAKEYASIEFKAEVIVDETPYTTHPDWKCLGEVSMSGTWTDAEQTITVTSSTGVSAGMLVYADGIDGGVVTEVDGTTITIDITPSAAGTDAAVKFITEDNLKKSNIAYWIFEKAA
jgi:hypothetical protein